MSVITLTTDFGLQDGYVGIMKGVILSICPSATIVDITHAVSPQDIREAAYRIQAAYRFFPPGTVHLVVVDPGVGSSRAIVAMKTADYTFIFPDNGVLTLIADRHDAKSIVKVENSLYFLEPVSATFQGRDIFAPVAAHTANGVSLDQFGTPLPEASLVRLKKTSPPVLPSKRLEGGHKADVDELIGQIVFIDRFGNLVTDIDKTTLDRFDSPESLPHMLVVVRGASGEAVFKGIVPTYANVPVNHPLALIGSSGYLEVAVNGGNAARYFQVQKGDWLRLRRKGFCRDHQN